MTFVDLQIYSLEKRILITISNTLFKNLAFKNFQCLNSYRGDRKRNGKTITVKNQFVFLIKVFTVHVTAQRG